MLTVVTGGSASGKSTYAENLLSQAEGKLYIATMEPYDDECLERIARHRKMRKGKGFDTIECYTDIGSVADSVKGRNVLLECMSNLLANEMYSETGRGKDHAFDNIVGPIIEMSKWCENFVVVTNEIFSDGCDVSEETLDYIKILGRINRALVEASDRAVLITCGLERIIK